MIVQSIHHKGQGRNEDADRHAATFSCIFFLIRLDLLLYDNLRKRFELTSTEIKLMQIYKAVGCFNLKR